MVSSPAATGGAGTTFEQSVGATLLARLRVRGVPPILSDCLVEEVCFQAEHLGWETDDFVVTARSPEDRVRRLLGQVKKSFKVSYADDDCKAVIVDAWTDFGKPGFNEPDDRVAIVVQRGTNVLLEDFSGLLDAARAARSGTELETRLLAKGMYRAKVSSYCDEIRKVLDDHTERSVSFDELWRFLRILHVLPMDLATSTNQTRADLLTMLGMSIGDATRAEAAWMALVEEVRNHGMPQAKSYRLENLEEILAGPFAVVGKDRLQGIRDHSAVIIDGIRSTIGDDVRLDRATIAQQVIGCLDQVRVVLVTGVSGSGKSAVAKEAYEILGRDHVTVCIRAETFAVSHIDEALNRAQWNSGMRELCGLLAAHGKKIVLIESLERLLERGTRDAFIDFLQVVRRDPTWHVVMTCRDYSIDLVRSSLLEFADTPHLVVRVPDLIDHELDQVANACPKLARPIAEPSLRKILRNPYVLDRAARMRWDPDDPLPKSEREFRQRVWSEIVRDDLSRRGGMPTRRSDVIREIAVRRARALSPFVDATEFDAEVLEVLERDSLIRFQSRHRRHVALAHDVLEDWAILELVDGLFETHRDSLPGLREALGTHPAIRRTFRKWMVELVHVEPDQAGNLFDRVVSGECDEPYFEDDVLVAILKSPNVSEVLAPRLDRLFDDERRLLRRLVHLLRVACVRPPDWWTSTAGPNSLLQVPDGDAWCPILDAIAARIGAFEEADHGLLIGLLEDWRRGLGGDPHPDGANSVATIAYALLEQLNDYSSDDNRKRVLKVVASIPLADERRFSALFRGEPRT